MVIKGVGGNHGIEYGGDKGTFGISKSTRNGKPDLRAIPKEDYDTFSEAIGCLVENQYQKAIGLFEQLPVDQIVQDLLKLSNNLLELSLYASELSQGNLSIEAPHRTNYIASNIKDLHSKLKHLVWQIGQVAKGDYGQAVDYMGELSDCFNSMLTQLRQRRAEVDFELNHDVPTGLLNRDTFMREVYRVIEEWPDEHGALFCGGLDNIKFINEKYGYKNGDRCILAAAGILQEYEERGAIVARIAGDEFAVYLPSTDEIINIDTLEVEMRSKLSVPVLLNGESVKIRMSFGYALYPQDALTADSLLKYASHTMFEVKKSNRGTIQRFSKEFYQKKSYYFDRQEKLSQLIDERQLRFVFQPIYQLDDFSIYGYEALMRPTTNDFSGPLDILLLAEAQSKLGQIEQLTFELIFDLLYRNLEQLGDLKIFFNTISTKYLNREQLGSIHPHYEEICRHMVFEVLENTASDETFLQNIREFRQQIDALVAIDDYGCGYSNDLRLMSIAPDIVKIDKIFIQEIDKDPDKQHLLSKIITYCKAKDIHVLAEGIETAEELESVISLGCLYGQGYFLGRPQEVGADKHFWRKPQ